MKRKVIFVSQILLCILVNKSLYNSDYNSCKISVQGELKRSLTSNPYYHCYVIELQDFAIVVKFLFK